MALRGSLSRKIKDYRVSRQKSSLSKQVYDTEKRKAYLEQIRKEGARRGREDAIKKGRGTGGFKKYGVPTLKGTREGLQRGARFSEKLLLEKKPEFKSPRQEKNFVKDYEAYRKYLKSKKRKVKKQQPQRRDHNPMNWIG